MHDKIMQFVKKGLWTMYMQVAGKYIAIGQGWIII